MVSTGKECLSLCIVDDCPPHAGKHVEELESLVEIERSNDVAVGGGGELPFVVESLLKLLYIVDFAVYYPTDHLVFVLRVIVGEGLSAVFRCVDDVKSFVAEHVPNPGFSFEKHDVRTVRTPVFQFARQRDAVLSNKLVFTFDAENS